MNDTYVECLVERKDSPFNGVIRIFAVILTIALIAGGLFISPFIFIAAVLSGAAAFFLFPYLSVEYEYLFMQRELTIDCIYSKSRRKNAAEYNLDKMEFFAPEGSPEIIKREGDIKNIRDFSSGNKDRKRYIMIINTGQGREKVILEPEKKALDNVRMLYPSKVSL